MLDFFKDIVGEWRCSGCNAKIKRHAVRCPNCKSILNGER